MQRKMKSGKFNRVVLGIMVLAMMFFVGHYALADEVILETNSKTIYLGQKISLEDYLIDDEKIVSVKYELSENNNMNESVELTEDGTVKGILPGIVNVNVTCTYEDESSRTENFSVQIVEPKKYTFYYGQKFSDNNIDNLLSEFEDSEIKVSNNSLSYDEGEFRVEGFEDANILISDKENEDEPFVVVKISVIKPSFKNDNIARAIKLNEFNPELNDFGSKIDGVDIDTSIIEKSAISWDVYDKTVATASEKGIVCTKIGKTNITATITAKNGDECKITAVLYATDPTLNYSRLVIAKGKSKSLTFSNVCEYSDYQREKTELQSINDAAYISTSQNIYAAKKGTATVGIIVDGKKLYVNVIVTDPKYSSKAFIMYKKQKKTMTVSGLNKTYSSLKYSSSNKKVATVSSKGKVSAKKSGRIYITITADYKKIKVLVEVTSKAGYKASKKAIAISKTKTKYSQIKRMKKGYYDCSSLVSRAYRPYGVYFGKKSGWSPTAASIGAYCSSHKKVLYRKGVSSSKLLPGDLIFYSYKKNGRYRNISHIEIYVGNGKSVSASSSNNRVIHYGYRSKSCVLIARPVK